MSNQDYVRYDIKELIAEIHRDMSGLREDVRDRYHKLASSIEGLNLRLTEVERTVKMHEDVRLKREPQIDELIATGREARKVREAIEELRENSDRGFSRKEKVAALVLGFGSFSLLILQTIH